jgi:hypothetical protein
VILDLLKYLKHVLKCEDLRRVTLNRECMEIFDSNILSNDSIYCYSAIKNRVTVGFSSVAAESERTGGLG